MPSPSSAPSGTSSATTVDPPPSGRVATLTLFAILANALPLPLIPDTLVVRVRGAMAHDIAARRGLSLTNEARTILAHPGSGSDQVLARKAGETVVREILKRLGPLAIIASASRALEVFALGHLLERYIERVRASGSVRIDIGEAKRLRDAIDKAVIRAFSPTLTPASTTLQRASEDLRGELTRWIDAVLLTGASLPSYIERRLEAAFDEIVAESSGLRDG